MQRCGITICNFVRFFVGFDSVALPSGIEPLSPP
jgi:hypothetical protein